MTDATLVSALYGAHAGRHVLVVGGGPSAPAQLRQLSLDNPVIISANAHAFKLGLKVDYVVCKDHQHTETRQFMEPLLRPLGAPIVTYQHWGDFRIPHWPAKGNSGAMAIGLAAMFGASLIVPIGMDGYQTGTYFHDLDAVNVSAGKPSGHWKSRFDRLRTRLEGAVIRPVDGLMTQVFRPYNRAAALPPARIPLAFDLYKDMKPYRVRALPNCRELFDPRVQIPEGFVFPVSADEARRLANLRRGELIGDFPLPTESREINRQQQILRRGC
jgi:hypothetical protein